MTSPTSLPSSRVSKTTALVLSLLFVLCAAVSAQSVTVLPAGSLEFPVGMFIDAQDRVWITEAGTGSGQTGKVTRYDPATGITQTVFSGFASVTDGEGNIWGVHHMAQDPNNSDAILLSQGGLMGTVEKWSSIPGAVNPRTTHQVGNFVVGAGLSTNTYSVAADTMNNLYVVDAAANAIVKIDSSGGMSVFATFPNLPQSGQESVPTKILATHDGFYVCNLTGVPCLSGAASLFHVDLAGTVTIVESGLTTLVDVAVDPADGRPVVLSFGQFAGNVFLPNTGTVTKITATGTHTVASGLSHPTGMGYTSNGDLYVHSSSEGGLSRFTSGLSMSLTQGTGWLALDIQVSGGVSNDPYFLFHSFDSLNGAFPGGGWLGGLHISVESALAQYTLGSTQTLKIFGGLLGPAGGVGVQVPGYIMQQFSGLELSAMALSVTPGVVVFSNIATVTVQ